MKTKNILFGLGTFFIALFLFSMVSAISNDCANYGTYNPGESINLIQTCTTCSGINASIVYPNGSQTGSFAFQNINNVYNYTFTNTEKLGNYNVIGLDAWCYYFKVGYDVPLGVIIAFIIVSGLLFFVSTLFAKEQKGVKTLLIMFGIGFILLTMQIAKSSIPGLEKVMNSGLIMGLVLLIFMLAYFMIMYTKEIFIKLRNSWKEKKAASFGEVIQ